jgi:glycosyltransferase involved in cell wall biosynthesis
MTHQISSLKQICLIGAFPPPVYGASLVNAKINTAIKRYLSRKFNLNHDINIVKINLAPPSLKRDWYVRLSRTTSILAGVFSFLKFLISNLIHKEDTSVYIGLSGGYGQIYEVLFTLLARLFHAQIFLHHHSYAYLDRKFLPTDLLTRVAANATHIVLCQDMEAKLRQMYNSVDHVSVLSNSAFISTNLAISPKTSLQTIGFLSNIAPEKGIFEFLDVMEQLQNQQIECKALIAGPFQDQVVETQVMSRLANLDNTIYVGAKYGDEKVAFLQAIDLLLFPTKYVNEAEPLTIYEAMSFAVPAIAFDRGCISCMIGSDTGLVISQSEDFVTRAVTQIKLWQDSPASFQQISAQALAKLASMCQSNRDRLAELLGQIVISG